MADLQNPIVPVPDTSAVTKGLALYAVGRRQQQVQELAYQKMVQDAALDQEKFGLTRQQLAQQYELQRHQMSATDAEANLRNAQANYYNTTKAKDAKDKTDAMDLVEAFKQDISGIPNADVGTESGANQLQAIMNNDEYAPIWGLPIARSYAAHADLQQRLGVNRRREDYKVANSSYNSQLTKYGIPQSAMDVLEKDPKTGELQPNDIWRKNDDGSMFLAFQPPIVPGAPSTLLTAKDYAPGGKAPAGISFSTLQPTVANQLLQMRDMVGKYRQKLPLDAIQDAHAQQIGEQTAAQQQRASAAGIATPANPQPGDLYKGYRFIGGDPSNPASWQQAQ